MKPHAWPPRSLPLRALPLIVLVALYGLLVDSSAFHVHGRSVFTLADDPMISMEYARTLAHGHGLVWYPGAPHVEGYTNFLWTTWMAVLQLVPIRESYLALLVMASGLVALAGNVLVVERIASRLGASRPTALLGAAVVALYYPLAYWTQRGFEVGVGTLAVSSAALLALRLQERWRWRAFLGLVGVAATASLIRDDLVVPSGVAVVYAVAAAPAARRLGAALLAVGGIGGVLAAHALLRLAYYGDPLPNTYYLKVTGVAATTRLHRGIEAIAGSGLTQLSPALLLAVAAVIFGPARRSARSLPLAIFLATCAYAASVGGDAWEIFQIPDRYITVAVPLLLVSALVGVETILVRRSIPPIAVLVAGAIAAVVAAYPPLALHEQIANVILRPMTRLESHLSMPLVRAVLVCCVAVAVLAAVAARIASTRAVVLAAAALVLSFDAIPLIQQGGTAHYYALVDESLARTGLALRAMTRPGDSIAFIHAGNAAYFSHRPAIDLLGKSDRVIAHGPPATSAFLPGHTKWNYRYSIGVLRPDVIAEAGPAMDVPAIERRYGYRQCGAANPDLNGIPGKGVLVKNGSGIPCLP